MKTRRARCTHWVLLGIACSTVAVGNAGPRRERSPSSSMLSNLGYAVRETLPGRGATVLVISDVHDSTVTGVTLAGLVALHDAFRFEVAGFENYDRDFRNRREGDQGGGPVNTALVALLNSVDPELTRWARERVRRRGTSSGGEVLRYHDRHPATTFGIERGDSSMLFVRAAFVHGELLADLERAWSDSSKVLPDSLRARGLSVLGSFLAVADSSCPRLAPGQERSPEGLAALRRALFEYGPWLNRYVLDDRNRGFAQSVAREMSARGATRAVVMVGYAHTMRPSPWPTVQDRLHEFGATVMVADPPAVQTWLDRNPLVRRSRP